MKKQNENIQLHIISEDYKEKKKEQNNTFSISEKAILVSELQDKDSLFEQLNKMHEEFDETKEPDSQIGRSRHRSRRCSLTPVS